MAVCLAQGQPRLAPTASTELFHFNASCNCIKTRKTTSTLQSVKGTEGKPGSRVVFQSFRLRTEPDMEIFRVDVAWERDGENNGWWNYGIADEGDYNNDGQPDYSWYGSNESGSIMFLFLSSPYGYIRVDVLKTIGKAWEKRFHQPAPDFSEAESSNWGVEEVRIQRSGSGLELNAVLRGAPNGAAQRQPDLRFAMREADFVH